MRYCRDRHGHKYAKYKICISKMMVICTKQHLNNIWSSIHEKLSNTEDELKKGVAYIKTCILVWLKNSTKWKITMTMWNIEYTLSVSQTSGAESLARIRNNFLVQIIRSLSTEGRVFLRRRKILFFFWLQSSHFIVWVRICRKIGHNFRTGARWGTIDVSEDS